MSFTIVLGPANEIRFFVKQKCQTSTIILSLGTRYCERYVICDVNHCTWAAKLQHG